MVTIRMVTIEMHSLTRILNGVTLMVMATVTILRVIGQHSIHQWADTDGDGYGDNQNGNNPTYGLQIVPSGRQ